MNRLVKSSLVAACSLLAVAAIILSTTIPIRAQAPAVYLPVVLGAPKTPAGCQPIPGTSYNSLPIVGSPTDHPAAVNPDMNLDIRGWKQTDGTLGLVQYNGGVDVSAPQLWGLFTDSRVPTFTAVYQVYNWNWDTGTKGEPITDPSVTLAGMQVRPGEIIQTPPSGYDIGQGYTAQVLYATTDQITLTYTGYDSVAYGYAIHVEGVCVEPSLLALYQRLNDAGRTELPVLRGQEPFGRANGTEIDVAIRDTGTFMDPRSQKDWWQGK